MPPTNKLSRVQIQKTSPNNLSSLIQVETNYPSLLRPNTFDMSARSMRVNLNGKKKKKADLI